MNLLKQKHLSSNTILVNKKKINLVFSLSTSFNPGQFGFLDNTQSIFKSDILSNQLLSKNFFFFFFLIKYLNKKNFNKNILWVKPLKKKSYTFLKSPYRHKLARHQIKLFRYDIFFKMIFFLKEIPIFKNIYSLKNFVFLNKKYFIFIESNMVFQSKINFNFFIILSNFFCI